MSTNSPLVELRIKLDNAITYGSKHEAVRLAQAGLKQAEELNLSGEVEYFKGQLEILEENYSSAIKHFDAAIRFNPQDGAAYNDRALCMVELGMINEAMDYFNKGIAVEPDYATIYHNKGWLLNNIGRHSEAVECFKKALSLEPERPVTYDNLADALYNLGKFDRAIKAYEKVLELLKAGCCDEIRKEITEKIKSIREKISLG